MAINPPDQLGNVEQDSSEPTTPDKKKPSIVGRLKKRIANTVNRHIGKIAFGTAVAIHTPFVFGEQIKDAYDVSTYGIEYLQVYNSGTSHSP